MNAFEELSTPFHQILSATKILHVATASELLFLTATKSSMRLELLELRFSFV